MLESHAHRHDARADAPVVRDLIADDRAGGGIHDEPDVALDPTDFDIGFISSEGAPLVVVIGIYKRLYTDGGRFAVVGDLLMGDLDPVKILHGLGSLSQRKPEVYPEGQAE